MAVDGGSGGAADRPGAAAVLAGRRRSAGHAAPAGSLGAGVGDRYPRRADPCRAGRLESEWGEFRAEMRLARRSRQSARGRAALLRFRQKAGLIRVQATVDWVKAQVEAERQVAVSVEF